MKGAAMPPAPHPVLQEVVLLGGGHSHVEVLRKAGMQPTPGVRLTLVTKDLHTAYSGMLPGFVAGYYTMDESHIDLGRLAAFAGARLIHSCVQSLNLKAREVVLQGRPPIRWDVLSINVGITPDTSSVPGAGDYTIPIKPVSSFVERLRGLVPSLQKLDRPVQVAVVGGGAGGVEMSLALNHMLREQHAAGTLPSDCKPTVKLYSRGKILGAFPAGMRTRFLRLLAARGVELDEGAQVTAVEPGALQLAACAPAADGADGATGQGSREATFDECLWCTKAAAPSWLARTGLTLDDSGFVRVQPTLQCLGHSHIFAAGDVASLESPRPKAGVFAVREGPVLAENLRRLLLGRQLQRFEPQATYLSIVTTGDQHAVAVKGPFCLEGGWLWHVKRWIDRGWMRMYGEGIPQMPAPEPDLTLARHLGPAAEAAVAASAMRCRGCGGKVGASTLQKALKRLGEQAGNPAVEVGMEGGDDAALTQPPPPGKLLVHTVDFLRSFTEDPWLFGAITANHALGDCHAMGGQAGTALAIAVVPHASQGIMEETLFQMLAGALSTLGPAGCTLVGGHSCEGPELSLGFAVTGTVDKERVLRKGGMAPGQHLILTKPLGSGILLAAHMRRLAKSRWVAGAMEQMQQSSEAAAKILVQHGASACTDVTGFGLLGHALEMARASQVAVEICPGQVPILDGAKECSRQGVASSLHAQNALVQGDTAVTTNTAGELLPLLVDPQTGGGLLAAVPAKDSAACLAALKSAGYLSAAGIGTVGGTASGSEPLLRLCSLAQPQ